MLGPRTEASRAEEMSSEKVARLLKTSDGVAHQKRPEY